MSKDHPEPPPPPPRAECEGPYKFGVDRIAESGQLERANALTAGDPIGVRLDESGRAAVYTSDDVLIGWPSTHADLLENCLKKGFQYAGRVIERRGFPAFPIIEVLVTGTR